jgi:hypothetical protein
LLPIAHTLSGARVAAADAEIVEINKKIQSTVLTAANTAGTAARVTFLDAFAALDSIDYKNSLDSKKRLKLTGNVLIDNRYLDGKPALPNFFKGVLVAGGYQSIDGMHASGFGYADLASRALTALGLPHTATDRTKLLRRGFDEDTLLSNYPIELDGLIRLIAIARTLIHANHFIPEVPATLGDNTHLAATLPMLARMFTR